MDRNTQPTIDELKALNGSCLNQVMWCKAEAAKRCNLGFSLSRKMTALQDIVYSAFHSSLGLRGK